MLVGTPIADCRCHHRVVNALSKTVIALYAAGTDLAAGVTCGWGHVQLDNVLRFHEEEEERRWDLHVVDGLQV